jgi:hypothetical protein
MPGRGKAAVGKDDGLGNEFISRRTPGRNGAYMISYESHLLAGDNIEERRERLDRSEAKRRARNRESLIPDMEPERHEPAEWFAEVGYHAILKEIGKTQPDYDWSEELDSTEGCKQARADYLAARKRDMERVIDYLRTAEVRPMHHRDGAMFGTRRLAWVDRMRSLKTWAGPQTLAKLIESRQKAMKGDIVDAMTFEAPMSGASGFDRRVGAARPALENGFSVDETGMKSMTLVALELLAVIGLETIALSVQTDGAFIYEAGGKRWRFKTESRNDYYGRWGSAEEC